MNDIVERLKGPRTPQGGLWPYPNLHDEAADEIEKLREELTAADNQAKVYSDETTRLRAERDAAIAERDRLREALEPFGAALSGYGDIYFKNMSDKSVTAIRIKLGDLRRARAALDGTQR